MGYNICGFIVNQEPTKFINQLSKYTGQSLQLKEEIVFEEATKSKSDLTHLDVYTKNGSSLVFTAQDFFDQYDDLSFLSKENEVIQFMLGETSMVFAFRFYKNGILDNEDFYVYEPEFQCHGANQLNLSEDDDIIFDGFSKLLNKKLGKSFNEIDLEEKVQRYEISELPKKKSFWKRLGF